MGRKEQGEYKQHIVSSENGDIGEPFTDVKNPQLREFLTDFSRSETFKDFEPLSNLRAGRKIFSSLSMYLHKHSELNLQPVNQSTSEYFISRLSSDHNLLFIPTASSSEKHPYQKGIDDEGMLAYAAFAWETAELQKVIQNSKQSISKQEVLENTVRNLGKSDLSLQLALDYSEIEIFKQYFAHAKDSLLFGQELPEKPKLERIPGIDEESQNKRVKRTGTIPILNDYDMRELAMLDEETLANKAAALEESTVQRVVFKEGDEILNPETYAAMYFMKRYIQGDYHEYDPYPEHVSIEQLVRVLRTTKTLLQGLRERYPNLTLETAADVYQKIVSSAEDAELPRMRIVKSRENHSQSVDTEGKGT